MFIDPYQFLYETNKILSWCDFWHFNENSFLFGTLWSEKVNQSDRENYRELLLYNFLRKVREKKIINYTNWISINKDSS